MKIMICRHCDMTSEVPPVAKGCIAKCRHCNSTIYKNGSLGASSILALCFAALITCIPAFTQPLISVHLLSITEDISLINAAAMVFDTAPLVSLVILFCAVVAPLFLILSITYSSACLTFNYFPKWLPIILKMTRRLTHWSMLDVYMLGLFVSISKLLNDADLYIGIGFYFFVSLLLINLTVLANYSNRNYWTLYHKGLANMPDNSKEEKIIPPQLAVSGKTGISQGLQLCPTCNHISEIKKHPARCPQCKNKVQARKKNSLQKTWALLFTALIFIIPANIYPITLLMKNNILYPDTIFSGILTLIDGDMVGIAIIVFVASIVVPCLKILILTLIALSVQLKWKLSAKKQLYAYKFVDWIGKWSVLDLFVISIMIAVFDKGTLLSVSPGIAASAFTVVVMLTILAAECFDARLIWDSQSNDK